MNNEVYTWALVCGRFQTFHLGHKKIIDRALKNADKVLVIIGSAQVFGTERNPYPVRVRKKLVEKVYANNPNVMVVTLSDLSSEDEISNEWGTYLLSFFKKCTGKDVPDIMVYGNDEARSKWFDKEQIKGVTELIVARDGLSATQVREYMVKGDYFNWRACVPEAIKDDYELLRALLATVPYYKELMED